MVRGSNHAVLNVFSDRVPGRAIVIVAIDNLVKGQAGQGVQALNLLAGLEAGTGLPLLPFYP
jgi:N-acetyl-gamma-glutamyl-phosphate reductase